MKKALLICAVVITLLAAVSGTIAYFTDTVEGYGQAASGELSILQHEYDVYDAADAAKCTPYTQGQMIYPGVSVNKVVTVENIGKNVTYVRTFIAVPTAGEGMSLASLNVNEAENNGWVWGDVIPGQSINDVLYDIYVATYTTPLNPGETTAPSLMGYTVSPMVSQDGAQYVYRTDDGLIPLGTGESFNILVATEASQAIVFSDANEAMLETFGKDHHPWQTVVFVASQTELDTAIANAAGEYNTRIGLYKGTYTLPDTLPNGIRIFAMDTDVEITNATLAGYDIEIDGVIFPNALSFTGHGDFESVSFQKGWIINPTTGDCFVDSCTFASHEIGNGEYRVIIQP